MFYLQTLQLTNFKNYEQYSLEFAPKLNALVGNNGMGKTNILDAIHYLCVCKSHFNASDKWSVRTETDFFRIEGKFVQEELMENVVCKYSARTKKIMERNRVEYSKLSEHIGRFPVVFIAPDDTYLLTDASEYRRQFVDFTLVQLDMNYLQALQTYNKVLEQRNEHLKQASIDHSLLDIYDQQLYKPAQYIYTQRKQFVTNFLPIFQDYYRAIANGQEEVRVHYDSDLHHLAMDKLLVEHRKRDIQLERTTAGIHKDDLECLLNEHQAKRHASQGQRKSYLLALKLAQYEMLRQHHNVAPILLLDDIFDKLDALRVGQLLNLLLQHQFGQIFITDTDQPRIEHILDTLQIDSKIFKIGELDLGIVD